MKNSTFNLPKKILVILIGLCLFYSCSADILEEEEPKEINLVTGNSGDADIIKDQYIILLSKKPGNRDRRAVEVLASLVKEVRSMPGARMKGTYKHALTGFTAKLTPAQVKRFQKDSRILSITPDRIIELEDTEVTSAVTVQEYPTWGLDRMDQREQKLDRAYSYTATGSGVNAYIMDSGIRYLHDEFEGRASLGVDLVLLYPEEEYDVNDPNLEPGNDCHGHGTHVAGTIGGNLYGVAKTVNLVSVRVFSCKGFSSYSRIIQGVEWVTENAVKPAIVNMSLGGAAYEPLDIAVENSISTGINYALAAGNANSEACDYSPARTPSALTVGASMIDNQRADFSNFGDCLDIYAPGYQITSASHLDDTSVRQMSGTSMAAPHVAGLAALYLEKNPKITPVLLQEEIIKNSTPDAISNVPSGTTSLVHSLWDPVVFSAPVPPNLNLKAFGFKEKNNTIIHLTWEPTEDPFIEVYRNGSYFSRWYNDGRYKLTTKGKGNDVFQVCEINYDNCSAEAVANFDDPVDFEPNISPVPGFTYIVDGLQVQFTDTSTDEDGTIIAWTWYFGDGSRSVQQHPEYTYSESGTYKVEFMIQDNYHDLQYILVDITVGAVNGNFPPTAEFTHNSTDLNVQFSDNSIDQDGSIVNWKWDFGDGNSSTTSNPQHVYAKPDTYNVNLLVTDNEGATATILREVTVNINEPAPGEIILIASGYKVKGNWHTDLSWNSTGTFDIYRGGKMIATVSGSSATYTDVTNFKGGGSLIYKICEAGTTLCSNEAIVQF